ncbi:MAG: MFS transporter [Opitutaceae bacterium]
MHTPSPAPPIDSPASARKLWHVGTLTYTSGGLIALFLLLMMGDVAWSMRDRSVGPMAQWYLSHLNASNLLFGLLMTSFPAAIGLILGPILSVKSDRHRGKWGRRLPFLLLTTPFAALGMVGLALTPLISQWMHGHFPQLSATTVSLICFGVFWAAFEFATIASQAVFGGLINDVVPAVLMGRFYGLFRAVSLIIGIIFNFWIFGKIPAHFTLILLTIGAFYGVAFMWVCLKVKEGQYPPPPAAVSSDTAGIVEGFLGEARRYFRECFTNYYYVSVFIMLVVAGLTFIPVNTFAIPFSNSLGVSEDMYGKSLALTFSISLVIAYFLGWACDAFHPLRMTIASLAAYFLVTIYGGIWAKTPDTFLIAWVLHGVISGCYFTCAASLGQRLFPQLKYAQFASAAGIIGSVSTMAIGPAMGMAIDASGKVYRYTFVLGGFLSLVALIAAWVVYKQFVRLGGPKGYVAPE